MALRYLRFGLMLSIASALIGWLLTQRSDRRPRHVPAVATATGTWFERARPHCNGVEVETWLRQDPPALDTFDGVDWASACLALAGKTDSAKSLILTLQPNLRANAAGIAFEVGHPVADMGDDKSAGPIMELVVSFWPNHYMALYHAGASAYQLGQYTRAREHLESFLQVYTAEDGWTGSARGMLTRIREAPDAPPSRRNQPHE